MPNGAGRADMLTPLSPLVRSAQRYAMPHRIWPSASVIIKKPIPVERNANTAKTGIGFLMITLALGQILWGIAYRWADLTNGDNGVSISARPAPFGISLSGAPSFYYATLVVFLFALAAMAAFERSPFGASLRGTRDQARRMTALGYNVWLIRFLAFLFSGFWCSVAGLLYLYNKQF